jgi:hypothetical protein
MLKVTEAGVVVAAQMGIKILQIVSTRLRHFGKLPNRVVAVPDNDGGCRSKAVHDSRNILPLHTTEVSMLHKFNDSFTISQWHASSIIHNPVSDTSHLFMADSPDVTVHHFADICGRYVADRHGRLSATRP